MKQRRLQSEDKREYRRGEGAEQTGKRASRPMTDITGAKFQ